MTTHNLYQLVAASVTLAAITTLRSPALAQDFRQSVSGAALTRIDFSNSSFTDFRDEDRSFTPDGLAFARVEHSIGTVFQGRSAAAQYEFGINATFVEVTGFPAELETGFLLRASTEFATRIYSDTSLAGQQIPFNFVINSGELRIEDFASFEPVGLVGGAAAFAAVLVPGVGEWIYTARLTKDMATGLPIVVEHSVGNLDTFGLNIHPTLIPTMDGTDAVVSLPKIDGTILLDGSLFNQISASGDGQRIQYFMSAELEMPTHVGGQGITGGLAGISDPFALGTPNDPSDDLGPPFSPLGTQFFLNGQPLSNYPIIWSDGDFNDDGAYDCLDVDALVAEIASGTHTMTFDLTGDELVDSADLSAWLSEAGGINLPSGNAYSPGDADLNGTVDGTDFGIWNAHKFTGTAAWCAGDFNADGAIDGTDFGIWNSHKFTSAVSHVVPEPGFGWQLVGLAALWVDTRQRRARGPRKGYAKRFLHDGIVIPVIDLSTRHWLAL